VSFELGYKLSRAAIFVQGNLNLIRNFDGMGMKISGVGNGDGNCYAGNGTMEIKSSFMQTAASESVLLDSTLYALSRPLERRTRCALSHK